ncbi:MAG: hypothetical protein L6254_02895 [Candidatus Omnitrophica bacterium]|nr:hypothetical protein [Candidatus Omnitrophota bacterium]MCG2706477.1 hypothetical protein [Candidatus Omnitrophota bacterium]
MRYKIFLVLVLLLGIVVLIGAQFSIPTLFSADGYLHIRMADFLRQYGLYYDFHWARFSTFATNFADKDFLYHVLLIPFTFLPDIFLGAKLSAAIFTIVLYLIFWISLKRYCRLNGLIPIFLLLFIYSAPFLSDLSQPRNMTLIIALTLLFVHYLIQRKKWLLFIIAVFYALSHVSGPYLLLFAFLAEGVRFANDRTFSWESIGMVTLGLLAGFLIHPHFPDNLLVFYLNGILVPIFALKWGLELGAEFFPISTRDFVLGYPFILIGLVLLIASSFSRQRKISISTQIWMCIGGFFFVFSFFSQRYLIHTYPLILLSLASYFSDWWQSGSRLPRIRKNKIARRAISAVCALLFLVIGVHVYRDFRLRAQSELQYNQHYEAVGKWMSAHLPAGEVVFHANWSDSQYFIGLNPKNDYFVTLDPIYMYYWSPRIYSLYRQIAFGNTQDPYALLKNVFKVSYGYAGKNYFSGLISQIRSDQRFEILAEDYLGLIFRLKS